MPAGGYLLIYASGRVDSPGGELHAPFKLSSDGESVLLTDREGRAVSGVELPALLGDQAYSLDEDGNYTVALPPPPAWPNDAGQRRRAARPGGAGNASGVCINEFMASEKDRPHDWLEIYNSSAQAVDISGWGLSDDAASPPQVALPAGHGRPAGRLSDALPLRDGRRGLGRRAQRLLPPFRRRRVTA